MVRQGRSFVPTTRALGLIEPIREALDMIESTVRKARPDVAVVGIKEPPTLIQDHPERVGYLLKERVFDIATVVDALRRIVDGETVIDPTIVARLLGRAVLTFLRA